MPDETTPSFDDLPEAPQEAEQAQEQDQDQDEVAELKQQLEKANNLVKEKDRIAREERDRRKKESDVRRQLEAKLKESAPEEKEEVDLEPGDKTPIDTQAIVSQAKEAIKAEQYQDKVIDLIKQQPNITRAEAKAILEIVNQLPKSGNPELDVEFAFDRRAKLMRAERGFNTPAIAGAGMVANRQNPSSVRPETVELGKQFGLSKEDHEKYSSEIKI